MGIMTPSPFCKATPQMRETPADAPAVRKIDSGSAEKPSRSDVSSYRYIDIPSMYLAIRFLIPSIPLEWV